MTAAIPATFNKPRHEVAHIFRQYGARYLQCHPLPFHTRRLIGDIIKCRTSSLGGHERKCSGCDFSQNEYNSCRNRHCPKCQSLKKAKWLQARLSEQLPVGYFHNVFTLPHELNPLVLRNKPIVLNILFRAVNETLADFAKDPKWKLGGQLGYISILHTWDQQMNAHYHLHCIIPAGTLAFDKSRWIHTKKRRCKKTGIRKDFLFPVRPLSKTFKGKFLDFLKKAYDKQELKFPQEIKHLAGEKSFAQFRWQVQSKDWVVYSKAPFKGPEYVFEYLGRYVHRVAISNDRIKNIDKGKITFTYKDRKQGYSTKETKIKADLFISRFLLHELPSGFMKIRFFGFMSNRYKAENLALIRSFLKAKTPMAKAGKNAVELILKLTGIDLGRCPKCKKGRMNTVALIAKAKNTGYNFTFFEATISKVRRE